MEVDDPRITWVVVAVVEDQGLAERLATYVDESLEKIGRTRGRHYGVGLGINLEDAQRQVGNGG